MTTQFTKIAKETEKAYQFEIDGQLIWLPKRGTTINGNEVTSQMLADKLAQADATAERQAHGNDRINLVATEQRERSTVTEFFVAPNGDRTNEFKVQIFVGNKLIENDTAPRWAVERSIVEKLNFRAGTFHIFTAGSGDTAEFIIGVN